MATIGYLRVSSSEQSTQSQLSEIANRQNVECWSYAHASEASASSGIWNTLSPIEYLNSSVENLCHL